MTADSDSDVEHVDCASRPQQNSSNDLPALFWDRLDEGNESADAEALRALKAESTPEELALDAKEMGNKHLAMGIKLQKKFYIQEAIQQYNRGLSEPITDNCLKSVLHSNRAQAHILLHNWGNAIKDAKDAVRFDPTNLKAYYRGARAASKLGKFSEAITLCQQGLQQDAASKELQQLLDTAQAGTKKLEAEEAAQAELELHKREPSRQLAHTLLSRGWRIGRPQFSVHGRKPWVEADELVHWPVLFMYPQSMTNDVVEDVCETDTIGQHLDVMFAPDAPQLQWDAAHDYQRHNLDLFYLSNGATPMIEAQLTEALHGGWPPDFQDQGPAAYGSKAARWQRVKASWTLRQLLNKPDYVVPGIPVVFVVARNTPYYERFVESID